MALPQSARSELLDAFRTSDGGDLIRSRSVSRCTHRSSTKQPNTSVRHRMNEPRIVSPNETAIDPMLTSNAGDVELQIPKLRKGSFFPIVLKPPPPYRPGSARGDDGGHVHGTLTRSVEDLVEAMGGAGVSKSEVLWICAGSMRPSVWSARGLDHVDFPYIYLDATYPHVSNHPSKAVLLCPWPGRGRGERCHRAWGAGDPRSRRRRQRGPGLLAGFRNSLKRTVFWAREVRDLRSPSQARGARGLSRGSRVTVAGSTSTAICSPMSPGAGRPRGHRVPE